jgi:hypothetical protein
MKREVSVRMRASLSFSLVVISMAVPAFAATSAVNTNTVSPTLVVNVTVQKAIQLTLATGTECAVNAGGGGDYNINFGNVDALAINTPSCGNKFAPTTPGSTNAVYYSDYTVTPTFTSQSVSTNTLTAYVSSTFSKANLSIVQANAAPAGIGNLTAMSTNSGSQTSLASNATSGAALTRYLGVSVAPTNGTGLTGADSATITYTLTVQ